MGAITKRWCGGTFAGAEGDLAGSGCLPGPWLKGRACVRAIAEWLVRTFPTGTPPVGLPFCDSLDDRCHAAQFWCCHADILPVLMAACGDGFIVHCTFFQGDAVIVIIFILPDLHQKIIHMRRKPQVGFPITVLADTVNLDGIDWTQCCINDFLTHDFKVVLLYFAAVNYLVLQGDRTLDQIPL